MANHSEKPSYIFRAASELAPDAEVMAKNDVERYVHWLNEEHKADIEELNEEHGADIEQTWSRAREYYGKKIESLKAKELKEHECFYCAHPGGVVLNAPMSCWPYEAVVHFNDIKIQTTDDQTVNICTIRGIKFCPMCGRKLKEEYK